MAMNHLESTLGTAGPREAGRKTERVYANEGNAPLVNLLPAGKYRVLDVGCGAGDNARMFMQRFPGTRVCGITQCAAEAGIAREFLSECWVCDIEENLPTALLKERFDVLVFSHVLEHLRNPELIVERVSTLLSPGGHLLIALPNIAFWRTRIRILRGHFEYESAGILDDTHVRFYTYYTALRLVTVPEGAFDVKTHTAAGSIPLWVLRTRLLPKPWSTKADSWACRRWPNLFGSQVLIRAVKR
jgi:2-polyprenyl-3-methyl-5-hydroxy-6-metoxy-1,4-benzoquinol methylase